MRGQRQNNERKTYNKELYQLWFRWTDQYVLHEFWGLKFDRVNNYQEFPSKWNEDSPLPTETDNIRTPPPVHPHQPPFFINLIHLRKPTFMECTVRNNSRSSSNMDSNSGLLSFGLDVMSCQFFWPVNWILMNKIRKGQYLQRSHINFNWLSCGSSILVELEFGNVGSCGEGKPESNFTCNPRHSWLNFPWGFKLQVPSHF